MYPCFLLGQSGPDREYARALQDAEAFFKSGDYSAIATLGPWAARFPNNAELHHNLGLAYYRQQDFAKAAEHLMAAVGLEKENSPAWRQSVEVLGVSLYFCSRLVERFRNTCNYLAKLRRRNLVWVNSGTI